MEIKNVFTFKGIALVVAAALFVVVTTLVIYQNGQSSDIEDQTIEQEETNDFWGPAEVPQGESSGRSYRIE